jgi:acetyl-CoA carboxylase biotin carboxyl carrier protein
MKIDKKLIKELVDNLDEFKLSELEYQDGTTKIKVSKWANTSNTNKVSEATSSNNKVELANIEEGIEIKSPIIGTVYLAPEPGAKKFIQVGDRIKKGQTLMIVEAMKTMTHIPATRDGTVINILVKDGQPVEFGQNLILLK